MKTPFTEQALHRLDKEKPQEALIKIWETEPGRAPLWHNKAKEEVRKIMPLLAYTLDRLVKENGNQ